MQTILKNYYPLCYLSCHDLLLFKKGAFYCMNISSSNIRKLGQIPLSFLEFLIYRLPLLPRIFRIGIRCSIKISDKIIIYVFRNTIYEFDMIDRSISAGYSTTGNSRPLAFSVINDISGFEDGIYFGEYKSNPLKKSIGIFKRSTTDKWEKVYQFPDGAIEHIHNIIADKYNDTVFIFTGDFNNSAGIWMARDNFSSVEPLMIGDQKYRGCVAFSTPKGLIYATDGPFSDNSIRLLTKNHKNQWISKQIQSINGPSIYGCEWNDEILFSTSVEGDGRDQSLYYKLFGRKRGVGIKSDFSYIYKGNSEQGFNVIYKIKKDFLPFYLFQFGVLIFPSGKNYSNSLPIYHIATKKNRMSTLLISD